MDRFAMGRFVAELRAQRGLSVDDLACFIGSTPRRLLALEGGRAMLPPEAFRALSGCLDVSVAELFLGRRFTADDAPETLSAARADADAYLLFCTSSRRSRLRRLLAVLIDGILLLLVYILLGSLVPGWKNGAPVYLPLLLWLLHDATGQCSIGKYLLRLRVVNGRTLARARLWQRIVRNLPLLFPVSIFVNPILVLTRGRRLGDLLTETNVVNKRVQPLSGTGLPPLAGAKRSRTLLICLILIPTLLTVGLFVGLRQYATTTGAYSAALNAIRTDPRYAEACPADAEARLLSVSINTTPRGTWMQLGIRIGETPFSVLLTRENGGWRVLSINGIARAEIDLAQARPRLSLCAL